MTDCQVVDQRNPMQLVKEGIRGKGVHLAITLERPTTWIRCM